MIWLLARAQRRRSSDRGGMPTRGTGPCRGYHWRNFRVLILWSQMKRHAPMPQRIFDGDLYAPETPADLPENASSPAGPYPVVSDLGGRLRCRLPTGCPRDPIPRRDRARSCHASRRQPTTIRSVGSRLALPAARRVVLGTGRAISVSCCDCSVARVNFTARVILRDATARRCG